LNRAFPADMSVHAIARVGATHRVAPTLRRAQNKGCRSMNQRSFNRWLGIQGTAWHRDTRDLQRDPVDAEAIIRIWLLFAPYFPRWRGGANVYQAFFFDSGLAPSYTFILDRMIPLRRSAARRNYQRGRGWNRSQPTSCPGYICRRKAHATR
jgi:hypothetical protein